MENSKIILINKEANITSYKKIKEIKKELNLKKIGHAGTLDPLATGLIIAMSDKATKLSDTLMKKNKIYFVEMKLGFETDTLDLEGEVIKKASFDDTLDLQYIKETLNEFVGDITQIPPKYSAIKVNGKKLYDLARKNITVDIPKRDIKIYSITDIEFDKDTIRFRTKVSSGTYIRSLVRDIAYKLNTVATMTYLNRESIDKFKTPENYEILDVYNVLDYEKIILDEKIIRRLSNGLNIKIKKNVNKDKLHIFNMKNEYCGIALIVDRKSDTINIKRSSFFI